MVLERKKFLKMGALIVALLGVGLLAFVLHTFAQIPLNRLESYSSEEQRTDKRENSYFNLQAGSALRKDLLETYLLFTTGEKNFEEWIESNQQSLRLENDLVFIERDIELRHADKNQCKRVYCYQRRMSFERIPSVFWKGLIGIEDARFLDHKGVDLRSIARAIYEDIKAMSLVQGGSTITQQLVKNLFFTNEKSFKRKLQEVIVSLYLERRYPKENILEAYFNEVYWGSLGGVRLKGLKSASLFYFAKKPLELNSYEASILISMLKGPSYYNPLRFSDRLKARVETVYKRLKELNLFYGGQDVVWEQSDWDHWTEELQERVEAKHFFSMWRGLENESSLLNPFDRFVFTHKAETLLNVLRQRVDSENLAIKAIIEDTQSDQPKNASFWYYSKFERSQEAAITKERHQTGSLLKPFVYAGFVKHGKNLNDVVSTDEITLDLKSGRWSPREAAREFPQYLSLREALQRSLNRPVIRMAEEVGFQKIEDYLTTFVPDLKKPLAEYPAQLLGALELSLFETMEMFKSFLNQACRDEQAREVLMALADPTLTTLRYQLDPKLQEIRFFGKTGTSNDGLDNLFIAYDGRFISLFWVGFEGERKDVSLQLYGSTSAFQLYQDFILNRSRRFEEFDCSLRD